MSTEVKSGGSLAWAIMARSLFSRLGTACLLYLYVINVIYLVPNKAVKKKNEQERGDRLVGDKQAVHRLLRHPYPGLLTGTEPI